MAKSKKYVSNGIWRPQLKSSTGGNPNGEGPVYEWVHTGDCGCAVEGSRKAKPPKGFPSKGGWDTRTRKKYLVTGGPYEDLPLPPDDNGKPRDPVPAKEVCEMICASTKPTASLDGYPDNMGSTNHIR